MAADMADLMAAEDPPRLIEEAGGCEYVTELGNS